MLPLWLAMSASVALHLGALFSPGWSLPLDEEAPPALDARLLPASRPVVKAAPAVSAPVRRPRPRPLQPNVNPPPGQPVTGMPETPAPETVQGQPGAEPLTAPADQSPSGPEPQLVADTAPPAPSFASQWPRSGRIVYQVTRGEQGLIVGRNEQRWEHDGTHYRLQAESQTTGLAALFRPVRVMQESRGVFDAAGLRPQVFETRRDEKSAESVHFEPEQQRIVLGSGRSEPFVDAAQDMLSLFYQLGSLALQAPRLDVTVATGRKVATYRVVVGEQLALETPAGTRPVRHLKVTGGAGDDNTEIWLDTETRLPLKIRHRDRKGEVFDQVATLIETGSSP